MLTFFQNLNFKFPFKSPEFSTIWHPEEFASIIIPTCKSVNVLNKIKNHIKVAPNKNIDINNQGPFASTSYNPFEEVSISNPFDKDESLYDQINPFDEPKKSISSNKTQSNNPFDDPAIDVVKSPISKFKKESTNPFDDPAIEDVKPPISNINKESTNPFDEDSVLELPDCCNADISTIKLENKDINNEKIEISLKELPENYFNSSLTNVTLYQKKLVALEMLLLYSNFLQDLSLDKKENFEVSLRLALSLSRCNYENIVNKLTLNAANDTIFSRNAKRSLYYRFDIIQQRFVILRGTSNIDIVDEVLWFYRQVSVIICCLFWYSTKIQQFEVDHEFLSRPKFYLKVLSKADEILRVIWLKLNRKEVLDFSIFDTLKSIMKNVLKEFKLNENALYPDEFINLSYFDLVGSLLITDSANIENLDLNLKSDEFSTNISNVPSFTPDWKECLNVINLYFSSISSVKMLKEYSLIHLGINTLSKISTFEMVSISHCMELEIVDATEAFEIILTNAKELSEFLKNNEISVFHKSWFGVLTKGALNMLSNLVDIYNENENCIYNLLNIFKDLLISISLISTKLNLSSPFKDFKKPHLEDFIVIDLICGYCVYTSALKHYSRIKKNFSNSNDSIKNVKGFTEAAIEAIHTDAELYCPLLNKLTSSTKVSSHQIFLGTFLCSYLNDILDINMAPEHFLIDRVPSLILLYVCVEQVTSSYPDRDASIILFFNES